MVQSLTRAIPSVQSAELFSWLKGLYPIWAGLTPEMVRTSTKIAMAELLLSATLAIVALVALLVLFLSRHHFESKTRLGQLAFGLIFGGIVGNLTDRLMPSRQQVIDFIRFYIDRPTGEVGFPAFNIADSGICIGVALVFWITWRGEKAKPTGGNLPRMNTDGHG